jgi:hypothetical protein
MSDLRIIAEFNDYSGLVAAIRARIEELNVPIGTLDEIAGLPTRYVSKILGPGHVRRFSMQSLTPLLWTLGIKLLVVEDGSTVSYSTKLIRRRGPMHAGTVHILLSRKTMRRNQRIGGLNSRKYIGKRKVKQLARKAAFARWNNA